MKIKSLLSIVTLLVVALALYGCGGTNNNNGNYTPIANAYVTIDINPSIEIITGEDGLVVQVNALNDDAQVMLVDTSFAGKTVDETVKAIVQLATDMGYITLADQNAIIVTAQAPTEEETTELENEVTDDIDEVAEDNGTPVEVVKPDRAATPELKAQAQALGISLGKLKMIKEVMKVDANMTPELGATMSVKALNRILIDARKEMKDFVSEEDKDEYLDIKAQLQEALMYATVQFTNDALQAAEDTVFATLLEGKTVTVQALKDLYKAYFDEMTAEKNATVNTEDIMAQVNNFLSTDTEVVALAAQKAELLTAVASLKEQFRGKKDDTSDTVRNDLKAKMDELKNVNASIREKVAAFVATLVEQYPDVEIEVNDHDGEFAVEVKYSHLDQYKEIRAKYEGLFTEQGVALADVEALFTAAIQANLDQVSAGFTADLETVKTEVSEKVETEKTKLRDEKQLYKDTHKKGN